ncbi:Binding partner of acd11 [Thalictrum thalictroides]|uniref:Binding partner of acd11 n=1 Tax=Thalictrum thalictroides TaxID=46969 RepID=A0A7J6VHV6_THATH|nr:Binding partner of acd11 [Thalictrum thalictroides]
MSLIGYTVEVINLSPNATKQDVYDFFRFCGAIEHVEIVRSGEYGGTAYVTFKDAYALETAILLSGGTIVDQCVHILRHGHYQDDFNNWNTPSWMIDAESSSMNAQHAGHFVSSPGEAVTMAQEVVKTMVCKGYVLSKDALIKAKAFDDSYKVSSTAAAKLYEASKYLVFATGRTSSAAAIAFYNSSYFASGALWVSDALTKAAKVAADLGTHAGHGKN